MDSGIGSGVATVVRAICKILQDKGFDQELVSNNHPSGGYLATSLRRIIFNFEINGMPGLRDGTPMAAFDFDGFAFPKKARFVSVNQGVLGDIAQFESGVVRQSVRIMAALEARAVTKAEKIFVPSRFSAGKIAEIYGIPARKLVVMPNGVFLEPAPPPLKKNSGSASVLCVARLYKRKGVDTLLSAWRDVVSAKPDAVLKIVGGGLEYHQLRRMSREFGLDSNVYFLGDVTSREEMAQLYAECDLFCLPSRHETFGLAFLEAMSAGKPVVALNTTATPELVRHGVDGILVGPDGKQLAGAVISLLKDDALRENMGKAGRERVLREFLWEKTSEPLVDYFSRW